MFSETESSHNEVKGEGFDQLWCNINNSRQSSLEFEAVHFIKYDRYVGFYELFIIWPADTNGR